ncbi:uncharacterized protein LOC125940185 [Dermacentor silvarum]|uniref:uncharacterized protein LOC125940185 n=1 Tax=Dermacentor silvarum TaxID=543639 RepID=UPI002100ED43|nr:uncharacterized protein LOC125940185 [Dermacentor silvarum]
MQNANRALPDQLRAFIMPNVRVVKAESSSYDEALREIPHESSYAAQRHQGAIEELRPSVEAPAADGALCTSLGKLKVKVEHLRADTVNHDHRACLLSDELLSALEQQGALEKEYMLKKEELRRVVEYLRKLAYRMCDKYDFGSMSVTTLFDAIRVMVDAVVEDRNKLREELLSLRTERNTEDAARLEAWSAERDNIMALNEELREKLKDHDNLKAEFQALNEGLDNYIAFAAHSAQQLAKAQEENRALKKSLASACTYPEDYHIKAAVLCNEKDLKVMELEEKLKATEEKLARLQHLSGTQWQTAVAVSVEAAPSSTRDLRRPVASLASGSEEDQPQPSTTTSQTDVERTLVKSGPKRKAKKVCNTRSSKGKVSSAPSSRNVRS